MLLLPQGDIFFYVGDTLPQKYACHRTNNAMGCNNADILVHDQVYTLTRLEVDGSFGEAPGCNGGYSCTKYLMCNPDTSDKSGNTFRCTCQGQQKCDRTGPLSKTRSGKQSRNTLPFFGRADVTQRYPPHEIQRNGANPGGHCPNGFDGHELSECPWCVLTVRSECRLGSHSDLRVCAVRRNIWKYKTSKSIGGQWYSTPSNGNCDNPDALQCTWRYLGTEKISDANCVNGWLHKAVETKGFRCFRTCGTNSTNVDSDCWLRCFYSTLLGRLWPAGSAPAEEPMTLKSVLQPFDHGLHDGCPAMPPPPSPPPPPR